MRRMVVTIGLLMAQVPGYAADNWSAELADASNLVLRCYKELAVVAAKAEAGVERFKSAAQKVCHKPLEIMARIIVSDGVFKGNSAETTKGVYETTNTDLLNKAAEFYEEVAKKL